VNPFTNMELEDPCNNKRIRQCPLCGATPVFDETCPGKCGSLEGFFDDEDIRDGRGMIQESRRSRRLFGFDWANGFAAPFLGVCVTAATNALQSAGVGQGDAVVDLGCGDGRICRVASVLGAKATGYDLDEMLIRRAREQDKSADEKKSDHSATTVSPEYFVGDLFQVDLAPFSVISMFLLPETTSSEKLLPKLKSALERDARIISFGWKIPELGKPQSQCTETTLTTSRWFVYSATKRMQRRS